MRHSLKDRIISGFLSFLIAVVFVCASAVPDLLKQNVLAATVPPIQDSASAVNYATILGRATDFGIVANEFHHVMHMETTIAVNDYYQKNGSVTDVDFVNGTAQFIVAHVKEGVFALGNNQKAETYNIEVSEELYYATNPSASDNPTFIYPIPNKGENPNTGIVGYFNVDYDFTKQNPKLSYKQSLNVYPVATDTVENNVARIIENMQEKSAEIDMKANDEGYKIDYKQYKTTDAKYTLDFTQGDFVNKVIYINVDSELADKIAEGQLYLKKDDSTIICFNYPETGAEVKIGRMYVWDGTGYVSSVTGSRGDTEVTEAGYTYTNDKTDTYINQKIIFNIQTTGKVTLDAAGGTFLVPKASSNTEVVGSSTGWIVTAGSMVNKAEWHYVYKAVSQEAMLDGVGQIHFAARKAFTHDYDGKATTEDKTIFCNAEDYKFAWYETGSDYDISSTNSKLIKNDIGNQATNTIKFPTLTFYTDATQAGTDTDHLVLEGESKDFYYKVVEVSGVTSLGGKTVSVSDGWINIHLTVTNKNGFLSYTVSSETRLGDANNTVYKKNTDVSMSGVEFNLGAFFNLIEDQNSTSIDIVKLDDNGAALEGARFKLSGTSGGNQIVFNPTQLVLGEGAKAVSTTTSIEFVTGTTLTTIKHLDDGTYTLEEVGAPYGYTAAPTYTFDVENGVIKNVSPDNGTSQAGSSSFTTSTTNPQVTFTLVDGTDTTVKKTNVEISKVIAAGNTGEGNELEGATLTLTGKLANGNTVTFDENQLTKGTNAKFVSDGEALTFVSGSTSSIINDLPDGDYILREDIAPDGYQISTDIIFTISNGTVTGSTVTSSGKVVMEDKVASTDVTFIKTDKNGSAILSGATFELSGTYPSGNSIAFETSNFSAGTGAVLQTTGAYLTFVTGSDSSVLKNLPDGSYLLKETTAPNGYANAPEISFSISNGEVSVVGNREDVSVTGLEMTVKDAVSENSVTFIKRDSTNSNVYAKLAGATIELTGVYPDGTTQIAFSDGCIDGGQLSSDSKTLTFVTGADGVSIKKLPNGTYTLTETNSPSGYKIAAPIDFTVVDGVVTSSNGTVMPNPDYAAGAPWVVMFDEPDNIVKYQDIYFDKVDSNGVFVKGATIEITGVYPSGSEVDLSGVDIEGAQSYDTSSKTKITFVTGDDEIVIKNLPKASYTFTETNTPSGYITANECTLYNEYDNLKGKGFAIDYNSSVAKAVITMTDCKDEAGKLVITKTIVDADASSLGTLSFTVTGPESYSKVITFDASDPSKWVNNGDTYTYTLSKDIVSGAEYTVVETADGSNSTYTLKSSSVSPVNGKVTAVAEADVSANSVAFTNTYKNNPGSLKITKTLVGAELSELTGNIKFSIINKDTNATVKTVYLSSLNSTDWKYENGAYVCTIGNLPAGTYTVEETETANAITTKIDGSEQTSKDVTVNSGSVASVAVTNNYTQATTASLTITKSFSGETLTKDEFESELTFTVKNTTTGKYIDKDGNESATEVK
ncbi:MAG: hypothetical protein IKQ81_07270, partial [Clostridiales bacterium]|nr:hypothetical protein [Clostridiales bacterium]